MANAFSSLSAHVQASERRYTERVEVAIWSRIRFPGRSEYPTRIANVSASGLMAMTPCPVADNIEIEIELPSIGWHRAKIMWCMGDKIGAEFVEPIEDRLFQRFSQFQR